MDYLTVDREELEKAILIAFSIRDENNRNNLVVGSDIDRKIDGLLPDKLPLDTIQDLKNLMREKYNALPIINTPLPIQNGNNGGGGNHTPLPNNNPLNSPINTAYQTNQTNNLTNNNTSTSPVETGNSTTGSSNSSTPNSGSPASSSPTVNVPVSSGSGGGGGSYSGGSGGGFTASGGSGGGGGGSSTSASTKPENKPAAGSAPVAPSPKPATAEPTVPALSDLTTQVEQIEEQVNEILDKPSEQVSAEEIETNIQALEEIKEELEQKSSASESSEASPAEVEPIHQLKEQVEANLLNLKIETIKQTTELSQACQKAQQIMQEYVSQHDLTNYNAHEFEQELAKLTTSQAIAQYTQAALEQLKSQKQAKASSGTQPSPTKPL